MTSSEAAALGGVIRQHRLGANLTQEELGKGAGYRSGAGVSIFRVESGAVKPRPERLHAIAKALSTTVEALEVEAGVGQDESAPPRRGPTAKERRTAIEAAFLRRSEALLHVETAYFGAANRAVDDLATPFITFCEELVNKPSQPKPQTPPTTVDVDAARRTHGTTRELNQDLKNDASLKSGTMSDAPIHAALSVAGSRSLDTLGRHGADGLYALVKNYGKASTGTAIKDLSGAAQRSATLGRLGLRTKAAGGWGMTGGKAMLDTVATLPTVIVFGGVFALGRIKSRRDQDLKLSASEEFLALSEERFQAVIAHMTESTDILETATTHGSWSFQAWQEGLTPPSSKPLRDWSEMNEQQQARYWDLLQVTASLTTLLSYAPEDLLTAPSKRLPTIDELTSKDPNSTKTAGQTTSDTLPSYVTAMRGETSPATLEGLEETYRQARTNSRTEIRTSLGRCS